MKCNNLVKFLFFTLFLIFSKNIINAQNCSTCNTVINNSDTSAIVLNIGETLCIDTMGYFSGTIVLNGGNVCNKGFFKPISITYNSGVITNYANTSIDANLAIPTGVTVNNEPGAIITINGTLTISGGVYNNNGISNVDSSINNNAGTLSNTSIINCTQLTGSNSINNTGIINAN